MGDAEDYDFATPPIRVPFLPSERAHHPECQATGYDHEGDCLISASGDTAPRPKFPPKQDDTIPLSGSFADAAARIPKPITEVHSEQELVAGMKSQVVRDVILDRLKRVKIDMSDSALAASRALDHHSDLVQRCKSQSVEERELIAWLDENEVGWRNLLSSQDMDRFFGPEAMEERQRVRSYSQAVINLGDGT